MTALRSIAVLSLVGCGGSSDPTKSYKFHSGKGKVEGDLPKGQTIQFSNDADSAYVTHGPIQDDGSFSLTTYFHSPTKTVSGIPEGTYRVRINTPNSTKEIGPPRLPEKVTIKEGDPEIVLKLKGAK